MNDPGVMQALLARGYIIKVDVVGYIQCRRLDSVGCLNVFC